MNNEPNPHDPRSLWQDQEVENVTITVDEIRRRAARFQRRIHWRNAREYAAGAFGAIAFLVVSLWRNPDNLVPALLLIGGTIYAMIQLHRRGSARSVPADAGLTASLEFYRRELERQRDALRSVWLWYLLPFVPGLVAAIVVTGIKRGIDARLVGTGVFLILCFAAVWALNHWGARKLDRKIQELRAMEGNDE